MAPAQPAAARRALPPARCAQLAPAGMATYTTLRKQALVTDLRLRHRDIRALDPGVALPCERAGPVKGSRVLGALGFSLPLCCCAFRAVLQEARSRGGRGFAAASLKPRPWPGCGTAAVQRAERAAPLARCPQTHRPSLCARGRW